MLWRLAIDFLARADTKHEYDEPVVYKFADKPIVADAVSPILSKLRSLKRLSNNAWIVQPCHAIMKKLSDSAFVLRVELFEFPLGVRVKFNAPDHGA